MVIDERRSSSEAPVSTEERMFGRAKGILGEFGSIEKDENGRSFLVLEARTENGTVEIRIIGSPGVNKLLANESNEEKIKDNVLKILRKITILAKDGGQVTFEAALSFENQSEEQVPEKGYRQDDTPKSEYSIIFSNRGSDDCANPSSLKATFDWLQGRLPWAQVSKAMIVSL